MPFGSQLTAASGIYTNVGAATNGQAQHIKQRRASLLGPEARLTDEALAMDGLLGFVTLFAALRAFGMHCRHDVANSDHRGLQF